MTAPRDTRRRRDGSTLIEVLFAVLLLTVLAVAGGGYLYHSRAMVAIQRNRLIALELVNSRLEQVHSSRPAAIEPPGPGPYYLAPSGTSWQVHAEDPGEVVTRNHRAFPLQTTVTWRDLPGSDPASNACLEITARAAYRPETGDAVTLSTRYAP